MTNLNLQKRWNAYIERGGDLLDVPDEFRNQDLCNLFLDKRSIEKNEDLQARFIEYIERGGDWDYVPYKYKKNQDFWIAYINAGGYLSDVPVEYRNQDFWIAYINAGGYLSDVPVEYRNQVFWIAYINAGGYWGNVPVEFRNEQIQDLFLKGKKC